MPDIVSDATRIYEPPIEARNQVYLDQTNPGAGAAFLAGVEADPITLSVGAAGRRGALAGATPFQQGMAALFATGGAPEATPFTMEPGGPAPGMPPPIQSPTISADEANEQYAPRDLDGKIIPFTDKPMPQALAQLVGKEKTEAIQRESTLARFAATHSGLTTFAVNSIASQVGDPLSLGLFFVPPVGEAAILARVGEGFLGRTVARLGAGAVTGAGIGVVGAGIRGGIGALDPEAATDYSMRDALSDVLYSAAGFAVLHAGFGAGADVLRGLGVLRPLPPREGVIAPAREPALPAVDAVTQNAVMRTAAAQLADGRPVDVDSFFYRPPQADTAVGLALRPVGRAEIVAAPDVEAQARRIAPEAFARYDPLVQRANEIRAQIADPEATFGREIDQQIAELRARAEAARSAQAAPVGATPEEIRAGIAQQTAAYEAAVREADLLAAQRAALIATRAGAARGELGAVDAQLRDIAQTGEIARARAQAEDTLSARAAGRATVMGPREALPELPPSTPLDLLMRQMTLAREGWAPGMSQSELAAANEAVYGKRPEAERPAVPPTPAPRAAPKAAEVITKDDFLEPFRDEKGIVDMSKAPAALVARVQAALDEGRTVTLYADGKPIPITSVVRGMMTDAEGQRWGTMSLATAKDEANRVEIGPGKVAAAATSPEEALLEQQIAQLPPEALHPDDRAMIDEATAAVTEATTTFRSALETAASCIIGLIG
jgi:hypothetical protein